MTEWQSIETAPRDGSAILVTNKRYPGNCRICVWERGGFMVGWEGGDWTFSVTLDPQPTHWMPLPDPPEVQQ